MSGLAEGDSRTDTEKGQILCSCLFSWSSLANLSRLGHDIISDIVMDKAGRSAKDEIV